MPARRRIAIIIIILLACSLVEVLVPLTPLASSTSSTWSAPQRFTTTTNLQEQPRIIETMDGRVWLFWAAFDVNNPNSYPHIHYEVYNWSAWSSDTVLVASPDPKQDVAPSVAQLKNGTAILAFSSNRGGSFNIYLKRYNPATGWSQDAQITTDTDSDMVTSLLVTNDGKLWVFWDRTYSTGSRSIFVKTYNGATWSGETAIATNTYQNSTPSAYQMTDGKIWVVWSKALDQAFTQVYIYYRTTPDGVNWTTEAALTSSSYSDRYPTLMQDTANTTWLVWNRRLPISGTTFFQNDLFYKTSTNNGAAWSPDVQITNNYTNQTNDQQPTLAEMKDHHLWLFWSSNRNPEDYTNLYYATLGPVLAHDLAVTSVSVSPTLLRMGQPVTITVTVQNLGNFTENFTVNLVATNSSTWNVGSKSTIVTPGSLATVSFVSSNFTSKPGKYLFTASVPGVPGEIPILQVDNTRSSAGKAWLVPPGDVDFNGKVNLFDLATVDHYYGLTCASPGWYPFADLDYNCRINLFDLAICDFWVGTIT